MALWNTLPFQARSQFLIDCHEFFYRRRCEGVHWTGLIRGIFLAWPYSEMFLLGDILGIRSSLIWGVLCRWELSSCPLKHSSKEFVFPVTQSSVFSASCGFSWVFIHARVCSLVSMGSVKPGVVTYVIFFILFILYGLFDGLQFGFSYCSLVRSKNRFVVHEFC